MTCRDRLYSTAKGGNASRVLLLTRACPLTGERVTFILAVPRTVRGHREVSRSQKASVLLSAIVMDLAREPQEGCGAAPLGHLHGTSRQDTLPMANDAGIKQAEKKHKAAHRLSLSLDNRGPHKG